MRDVKEYEIGEIVTVNGYILSNTTERKYINNNLEYYTNPNIIAGKKLLNGKRGFYKYLYKAESLEKGAIVLGWSIRRTGEIDVLESQYSYWEAPEVVGNYLEHDLIVNVLYVMPLRKNSKQYCIPIIVTADQILP